MTVKELREKRTAEVPEKIQEVEITLKEMILRAEQKMKNHGDPTARDNHEFPREADHSQIAKCLKQLQKKYPTVKIRWEHLVGQWFHIEVYLKDAHILNEL